ncbi:polysaccharide (de)acetylase [Lunatibacter salilacus]|uniref:polysaccharide (de)acetylase n=1 Tax=Lunatibacter salilacus TaxID=2483804 RepID=UPI00131C0897|nr:polysaccharide (de)acetylase [Lunatibacter salilacus]
MSILSRLRPHLKNIIGKSVSKKYLIIESDDWGSIRMPSNGAFNKLKSANVSVGSGESARYNLTDTLASADDFDALFHVLKKFKDIKGKHPVFTAVSVVANPDFEKIKSDRFTTYYFESFTETLKKYKRESAIGYWGQGISEKLFIPEFHAREHLNVPVWMRMLQNGDKHTLLGFDEGCWGFGANIPYHISFQASFDLETKKDLISHQESIESGLDLFKELHGYQASFFVPPNGPFNNSLEKVAAAKGIKYIGSAKVQLEPQGEGKFKKRYHWLGQRNKHQQMYLTRNAFFEPNAPGKDWVSSCLEDIHYAFLWKKPAVISSHRTNYIGSLDEKNRKLGLEKLKQLLSKVLKRWPDVEFITSTELGNVIALGKTDEIFIED